MVLLISMWWSRLTLSRSKLHFFALIFKQVCRSIYAQLALNDSHSRLQRQQRSFPLYREGTKMSLFLLAKRSVHTLILQSELVSFHISHVLISCDLGMHSWSYRGRPQISKPFWNQVTAFKWVIKIYRKIYSNVRKSITIKESPYFELITLFHSVDWHTKIHICKATHT